MERSDRRGEDHIYLEFRRQRSDRILSEADQETWLTLLEQNLMADYGAHEITVEQDSYHMVTRVWIRFLSASDAAMFKLRDMK